MADPGDFRIVLERLSIWTDEKSSGGTVVISYNGTLFAIQGKILMFNAGEDELLPDNFVYVAEPIPDKQDSPND